MLFLFKYVCGRWTVFMWYTKVHANDTCIPVVEANRQPSAWAILIHSSKQHGGLGFCRRTLWSTATGRDWTSDPAISEQPALPPEPTSPLLIKCLQNRGCSVDMTRCRKPVYWKSKGVNSIGLALSKVHLLFAPPKNNHRWKVDITPHGVCVWRQLDC